MSNTTQVASHLAEMERARRAITASLEPRVAEMERARRAITASLEPRVAEMERARRAITASLEPRAAEMQRMRRSPSSPPQRPRPEDSFRSRQDAPLTDAYSGIRGQVPRSEQTDWDGSGKAYARLHSRPIRVRQSSQDESLLGLQFDLRVNVAPVPQPIESRAPLAAPDPQHWKVLCELERRLRIVVKEYLLRLVGPGWVKQRVPEDVRYGWLERQNEDRADDRPVYEAIEYANFMDLSKVIARRDNWQDVFQYVFRNREEVSVSLHRLHPVRKALAHSRPLSEADVLTLAAEASWILSRLRIGTLH